MMKNMHKCINNERGSAAIIVIVILVLVVAAYVGIQLFPLYWDHWDFERESENHGDFFA